MNLSDHLVAILEAANVGVWHMHVPTREVVRNKVLPSLSRASVEELNRDWWVWAQRIHPADRQGVLDRTQQMFAGELDAYSGDYRVRGDLGDWVSMRTHAAVTERDASGKPIWISAVLIDISREIELVTAREALRSAELRLKTATEAANVGLWEWDVDSGALWFSDHSCRLLLRRPGGGPADIQNWRTIVHPMDLPRIDPEIVRYLRREVAEYLIEFRMRRGDDSWGWFLSKASATEHDASGRVKRIAGVLMDITTQHGVAERLALATEGANVGHWDIDASSGQMWVSEQWGSMLGYGASELPTGIDAIFALMHPEDYLRLQQTYGDVHLARKGPFDLEYRMRAKDGSWRWIHTKGRSVENDSDGRITRQMGVTMDVTDRKETELRLATAERLESLGRLAAGVAHEINTPIQYISDSVHFVREGIQELLGRTCTSADESLLYWKEQLPAAADRAAEGVARVSEIVRSMNVLTHADHAEMRPVDLARAIQSTLVVARNEYKHLADVETALSDLPPITAHGSQINQLILNLLINAAHAIADRPGYEAERGRITIRTYQDGGEAVLCVGDTGVGIPDTIQDRIFEPFFSTKEVGRGTGQGLSIVLNIVHAHGGSITFQSQCNVGTTFFVRLPIDRPEQHAGVAA